MHVLDLCWFFFWVSGIPKKPKIVALLRDLQRLTVERHRWAVP